MRITPARRAGERGGMETTQPADGSLPEPPPGASPGEAPGKRHRVQVSSPADVLAVIPHLLGFHPADSFVVLGAGPPGERVELGFRYDLPDPPDAATARQIAGHAAAVLSGREVTTVIAAGYGPGRLVTPVADVFAATMRREGLRLRELLRAENGRYWSYLCRNVNCCPPDGVVFDHSSHPAAAAMTAAGMAAYPDRAARASAVAPLTGDAAAAMKAAIDRAGARAASLVRAARDGGSHNVRRLLIDEGRRAVRGAIRGYRAGKRITDPDRLAWLMVVLADLPVRDDAWARMVPEHCPAHLALWGDIVRHASSRWLPAPASLLAFTAWQAGDGPLATLALERALAADPDYSMARLLRDILDAGVPPSAARLPMSPKEVAASYERGGRPARRSTGRPARRRKTGRRGGRSPAGGDTDRSDGSG
jgi:uncharacterized protein DUF4192